ncbi:MAG: hypothetical protein R3Y47_01100 [Lachnospiraceae bacterium]
MKIREDTNIYTSTTLEKYALYTDNNSDKKQDEIEQYIFNFYSFKSAVQNYCKNNKQKRNYEKNIEKIGKAAGVSCETVKNYIKTSNRKTPSYINICKALGKFLTKNEYAFLEKYKHEYKNEKSKIGEIYYMLKNFLELYTESECYWNAYKNEEPYELYTAMLDEVKNKIEEYFRENETLGNELFKILSQVRHILDTCEIPGVDNEWLELNHNLKLFDASVEIRKNDIGLYTSINNKEFMTNDGKIIHFKINASDNMIREKNKNFKTIKKLDVKDMEKEESFLLQKEYIKTLGMIFERAEVIGTLEKKI